MEWAALKLEQGRAAYDAESGDLRVKFSGSAPVRHANIPPHVYQNLLETNDPHFYYQYYIAPSRVSPARRGPISMICYGLKLALLLAACSLLMATDLDTGHGSIFEESELRSN